MVPGISRWRLGWLRGRGIERLPLVTLGLVASWLLVFCAVRVVYAPQLATTHRAVREAVDFAIQNPAVQIPPQLIPAVQHVLPGFESNEIWAFLSRSDGRRRGGAPTAQSEFDVLVARAFAALDAHPARALGVVPARHSAPAFAGHVFIHVGWVQLLGSVVLMLLAGPVLERLWGRRVFAGSLLCFALAGGVAFAFAHRGLDRPFVGGAAVIAGSVAAVVVRLRSQPLDLSHWLRPWAAAVPSAVVPAWALLVIGGAYTGALCWAPPGYLPGGLGESPGAVAAVAGGLLGALLAPALQRSGLEARFGGPATARVAQARAAEPFDFARVHEARARGESDKAWAMLEAETRRSARNRDAVTTFWEMAIEREEPEQAASAMLRLIHEELRRGAEAMAVAHWRELSEHAPTALLEPRLLLRLLPAIREIHGDENAIIAIHQGLDAANSAATPAEACRLVSLAAELDPDLAPELARRVLADLELPPAERARLTELVGGGEGNGKQEAPVEPPSAQELERLPQNAFYAEQDRSHFGQSGDVAELGCVFPDGAVTMVVPVALDDGAVVLATAPGREPARVAYSRVRAVSVAGVQDLGPQPVLLVDLLVDAPSRSGRTLRVLRLRSDAYDPRKLVGDAGSPLAAVRALVEQLLARSGAEALPDPSFCLGQPPPMFARLEDYHAEVLRHAPNFL